MMPPTSIEVRILSLSVGRLRVWTTLGLLALLVLPPLLAGLLIWLAALRYAPMLALAVRRLIECSRARDALEAACGEQVGLLARQGGRINTLEADLVRAQTVPPGPRQETEEAALFRQVGLHPRAPEFLVTAARRAFRAALHPDRHKQYARQAHHRYLRAESIFDRIEKMRS